MSSDVTDVTQPPRTDADVARTASLAADYLEARVRDRTRVAADSYAREAPLREVRRLNTRVETLSSEIDTTKLLAFIAAYCGALSVLGLITVLRILREE